jgi:UDP-2,3-diacylglucosamine pyrophosphatase LpxH
MTKRRVELVVISDVHLGTYGCQAEDLNQYLKSIKPDTLVLNGDIIDIWQFRKSYFPKSHLKVIKQIINMASKGTRVIYLTGNHDEALRRFSDFQLGNITLADKLILPLPTGKAWFFHGDIFDASIQSAKWLAKLGGWGYDLLILINSALNWGLHKMGKERYSLSKKIKNSVKKAISHIQNFEDTAVELAISQNYKFVICGHIHQPKIKEVKTNKGSCIYLNSGDWIENSSALEYHNKQWSMYLHESKKNEPDENEEEELNDLNLQRIIEKVTLHEVLPN